MLGSWDKEMNKGLSLVLESLIQKAYVKILNKSNGISIMIKIVLKSNNSAEEKC